MLSISRAVWKETCNNPGFTFRMHSRWGVLIFMYVWLMESDFAHVVALRPRHIQCLKSNSCVSRSGDASGNEERVTAVSECTSVCSNGIFISRQSGTILSTGKGRFDE